MNKSPVIRSKADKIPATIASYKDCYIPLTLVCTYKGMVLSQDIHLLSVLPGQVVLQAPQNRLLISLSKSIYLYSRDRLESFKAEVQEVKEGRIVLSNLTTIGRSWKERICERVQPGSTIYADFHMNKLSIRACIEELSTTGIRLSAYKLFEKGLSLHRDAIGLLRFRLPNDRIEMSLKAKVIYFKQYEKMVISGVRVYPSSPQADRLQKYVSIRRNEILQELNQKCAEMYEPQKVSDLYF